jgi:hypothetical protein
MTSSTSDNALEFEFRGAKVPVTFVSSIRPEVAQWALESEIFLVWSKRCEKEHGTKRLELHSVEIQSVDLFGTR